MALHEKIYSCRRKAGLSQEELAEKIGVSRQAVSKWETGESVPELSKIVMLADIFGVTTDWLLRDEEPVASEGKETTEPVRTWLDAVPGVIGRLIKAYGWLAGVYLAVVGAGFTALGALARYMVRSMMGPRGFFFDGPTMYHDPFQMHIQTSNPVSTIGSFVLGMGIVLILAGTALAVFLKRRSREK